MKWSIAVLFAVATLSGCIGDGTDNQPTPVELDDAIALWMAGAPAANIVKIGETGEGGTAEIDAWENYLAVMRGGGVEIIDISDPGNPIKVGMNLEADTVKDVKWSDDGAYIFTGSDDRHSTEETSQLPAAPVPFVGGTQGGIYVLDAREKENPALVDYLPIGVLRGAHMVFYYQHSNGDELVLGANADISINRFTRDPATLEEVARYSPDPTDYNRDSNVVDAYYQLWAHDMFAMYDEVDAADIMYVANWDAGLRIVDISDPANPEEIGAWMDFPEGHTGNLHTVATEWVDDRRITVGAVEVGFNVVGGLPYVQDAEPSVMYVWDTTDPSNIQLLGTWTNLDGRTTGLNEGSEASTHNLQIEDGRVTMAHYGLGIWVLDVSTPATQADPAVLGYYHTEGMSTWDVLPHDGVIWSSGGMGLQSLLFAQDVVGEGPRGRA